MQRKNITIRDDQAEWVERNHINLSRLVQDSLDVKAAKSEQMREIPERRDHDTYKEDHWRVVDIEDVDNVFVDDQTDFNDEDAVRVDIDGFGAASTLSDFEEGENVNSSVWLTREQAEWLYEQLGDALK